jgi:DNA-binding beta-propeller fold protein YncE
MKAKLRARAKSCAGARVIPLVLAGGVTLTFSGCAADAGDPQESIEQTRGASASPERGLPDAPELTEALTGRERPATPSERERSFTAFESGQVRPLALSADGHTLFAVNTPDNRLEVLKVHAGRGRRAPHLESLGSVMVGLEPVAVAVRSASEVWVVNHLSDSVSVVNVEDPRAPRVIRTLLVGDEPRDIVFAGGVSPGDCARGRPPRGARAFVTTAHRGQNTGRDPELTRPGVGRADVWVFDADAVSARGSQGVHEAPGMPGPLTVVTLFADTPRALAVSPDGRTVYAAAFHSGNQTTAINERLVTNGGGAPPPVANADGVAAPAAGLVVKYRAGEDGVFHWFDDANRVWDEAVRFSLPDQDVFAIDATLPTPQVKPGALASVSGVGTILFGMAVNPVTGKLYVANTEARNEVRFEGHNVTGGGTSVRGHLAESRITVVERGVAKPRHLNKHLDRSGQGTPEGRARTLAQPVALAVSQSGRRLYVAALGSNKIGVFDTSALESDTFVPAESAHIPVSGGGPTGIVLDDQRGLLFALTRFDNGISIIDVSRRREVGHTVMHNPEPPSIVRGRRFLYDATETSSQGDSSCASCHVFGDLDSLAWDLGDPDNRVLDNPGPFAIPLQPFMGKPDLHPMKGPMTTQSLRGMANHGAMHWRGDRTGGTLTGVSAQPDQGAFDERAAFTAFNVAFPGLLGRDAELTAEQMQAFADFILQVTYPPNPVRNLDNSLTPDQAAGREFYFAHTADGQEIPSDTFRNCNGCHVLDPAGNAEFGVAKPGFFGSDGRFSFESEPQFMKVPHLRNAYAKVGMFGMGNTFGLPIDTTPARLQFLPPPLNDVAHQGPQIRGFGFTHDGSVDTLFRFFGANVFVQRPPESPFPNPGGIPASPEGVRLRRQLEAFVLAFDSNLAPIVGQQLTIAKELGAAARARLELLLSRAAAGECEVVVRCRVGHRELGFLYMAEHKRFRTNRPFERSRRLDELLMLRRHTELTFTAVPPGSGVRVALDRDLDGLLDGDWRETP